MECTEGQLDLLKEQCVKLIGFCQEKYLFELDDSDHLSFMSLCFLTKQNDHMAGILKLHPHPDIVLISRTMIEGLIQLLWCFKEPSRAFQWRGYAYISDWRVLRQMGSGVEHVPPAYINGINQFIIDHGELFKLKKFKNKPIPEKQDPFHKNWRCGITLKTVSEEVSGDELYNNLYSPYSDWQHWGVTSIGGMIKRNNKGVTYGNYSNSDKLCSALAVAWQCLYQVMELNNSHHGLHMERQLNILKNEYALMIEKQQG